ncbi:Rv3235 family protein [Streptosporangium sp. NBC_01755]|uniref:Rv3235 family protein n=1 Tax=unclassified Streptosporangium TaxID=2632669 RepID=UPI002DDC0115|nr:MULTISPECIES: Rv3235 family protein [unclassified Streptosporangium]WSA24087.1 Rv3235 family protein [Streptosporangium sp. NBC_01810]WSC97841.1 Rv3235 family protein [Streptosporangium sp. NBC_01755]
MSPPRRPAPLPRIAPSPAAEPPYDDDRPATDTPAMPPYVQGTLALTLEPEVPAPPTGKPLIWGPPGAIPDERRLRALAQAVAEILSGRRPPASVSCHMTGRAQAELARSGKIINSARPPRAGRAHVSQPEDGVVEMCAVVDCGDRSRVLALRLERRGVRWLCTEFETTP